MKTGLLVRYHQNFREWALFADALGIDGVEIAFQDEGDYNIDPEIIKEAFQDRKAKVCALSIFHVNTLAQDPEERKKAKRLNTELIKAAAFVDAPIAVIGMGYDNQESFETNLESFQKEHEYYNGLAKEIGVKLAYYLGHPPNIGNSIEAIGKVVKLIPDINLKVDPVGIIRHLKVEPYEVLKLFGERVVHFHCKDILRYENYEVEPPVAMGEVQWNKLIAMLYEYGYDDYLVIEPHGDTWRKPENLANHIIISKRHLDQFVI